VRLGKHEKNERFQFLMRIILVAIHPYPSPQAVPLANAFLKTYTAATATDVELIDFFCHQQAEQCAAELATRQPFMIGFSMYTWNRSLCLEIASRLKLLLPSLVIFGGGPEATADPLGVLNSAPFDFLITGEGEQPFSEVCARLAAGQGLDDISGIALLKDENLHLIPRQVLTELDSIPSPYLSGILDISDYKGVLWQLARGCCFACEFCFDPRDGRQVRRFSLERVEAELRFFASHGATQVFVLDSTFNQDLRRAKAILRLIGKIAPAIHFHFEVRSEFIDLELAQLFARITCSLQIGLQSSNPQVLRGVGRNFNREDFRERVSFLNETGAVFGFDLMYGLPGDTLKGFCQSLDFALGLYPNHLDIFPLAVLPGTALADRSSASGLEHLPEPPYTLLSSPSMTASEMTEARKIAGACDIFYTRGKAVAWFNGLCRAAGLKPSALLGNFAEWLTADQGAGISETDLDDHQVWQLQRSFLIKLCDRPGHAGLLPVILDLVDYHHHYAMCVQIPPPQLPPQRELRKISLLEAPGRLAPSTRLAKFNYEIMEILEAGAPDVRALVKYLRPSGSWAVIYPAQDGIHTESIAESYFRLLEQLDGRTASGSIAARLGIQAKEARLFLEFAFLEGIILL
jgi:hypothetical protein